MRTKTCLLMILLSLAPVIAYPQNQEGALIQELYTKSGLEKQIAQIPLLIQAGFDQAAAEDQRTKGIPEDFSLAMRVMAEEAFSPDSLKATILGEFEEKLSIQDMKKVLEWLDSPTGRRCTKLEENAGKPESLVEIEQFVDQMRKTPAPVERLTAIRRLDSVVKATEANVGLMLNNSLAIAIALRSTLPVEQQRPLADIVDEIEKHRPQLEPMLRSQIGILLLYTYRDLTAAELDQYIEFAGSPAGSKYHTVAISGVKKALFNGSLKLGESIGNKMKKIKGQSKT